MVALVNKMAELIEKLSRFLIKWSYEQDRKKDKVDAIVG